MEKIISARLDESVVDQLERVTRRLGMTKKRFLEEAIRLQADRLSHGGGGDVWSETAGAWNRSEAPDATVRRSRRRFSAGFARHRLG